MDMNLIPDNLEHVYSDGKNKVRYYIDPKTKEWYSQTIKDSFANTLYIAAFAMSTSGIIIPPFWLDVHFLIRLALALATITVTILITQRCVPFFTKRQKKSMPIEVLDIDEKRKRELLTKNEAQNIFAMGVAILFPILTLGLLIAFVMNSNLIILGAGILLTFLSVLVIANAEQQYRCGFKYFKENFNLQQFKDDMKLKR